MKKFLSLLLISLSFTSLSVNAASEYDNDATTAFGVVASVGTSSTAELAPGKIFSSDEDFGEDMYMALYEKIRRESADLAMKRTIVTKRVTKEELQNVVQGSNITDLLTNPTGEGNLNTAEVQARYIDIVGTLAEEKELADLEVLAKMEVQSTELFANGDESDSGFDLLVDLDVIDAILFGKTESPLSNSGPGAPAGTTVVGPSPTGPAPSAGGGPSGGSPSTAPGQATAGTTSGTSGTSGSASTNPNELFCPVNPDFNNAVDRANRVAPGGSSGGSTPGSGQNNSGSGTVGGVQAPQPNVPLRPEPPANWSKPIPCNEIFCLKVEARYIKASARASSDNCIACHIEKINDNFKKTIDKNLSPSKVTGNLFEGPKCKRGIGAGWLKWNLVLIPQPILTPPTDDLVVKGDIIKNMISFYEKYYDNPGRCKDGKCKVDPNPTSKIAQRILEQAPEGTDQLALLQEIRSQVAINQQKAEAVIEQQRLERNALSQATQFSALMQEITNMQNYFQAFLDLYNTLTTTGSPCEVLQNKEVCS